MWRKTVKRPEREIALVTGADDNFAMPLAVSIRSTLDQLSADHQLRLFVIDGGLSETTKARLHKSWSDPRLTINWLNADINLIHDLPVSHHIKVTTYLRLLMPALLPKDVTRVIYMDADTLVRRDLADLWAEPQGEHAVLAVQDLVAPCFDADIALPTYERSRRHMCTPRPIPNYRELGLPPDAKYFNGGLLVANLALWRSEKYAERMIKCLRDYREHVVWWDQYALNVVLANKWRALDPRWNQGAHIFVYPNWRESPLDRNTFARLRLDPWVVHFCSPSKPWQYFCHHPFARDFFNCLDRTDWKGWRPERPDKFWSKWWDFHSQPFQHAWKARIRIAKHLIRERRAA